jgi:hypothetical protein
MRWAIVFLCATACLPTVDFDPPAICEVLPFRAPPSVIPRGVVSELDVPLIDGNCLPSGVTANVEIYDSENLPVQFELDLRSAGRSAIARLSVLPQRPGPLQIFVTFEPGLGRTTRTLFVAEPALPPLPDFSVATPCTTEALTTQGTWIFQLASTITVWRDGMLLQTFPSLAMAARGDTVWIAGPTSLERFVDRGLDFLVREPDVAMPFSTTGTLVAAGSDTVWSITDPDFPRHQLNRPPVTANLPRGLCAGVKRFGVATGDERLFMTCPSRVEHQRLCAFDVNAIEASPCRELTGDAIGFANGTLWLRDGMSITEATLTSSRSVVPPPDFTRASASDWFLDEGWPLLTDPLSDQVLLVLPGPRLQLAPPGVTVLGQGEAGILVELPTGRRAVISR